MTTKTYYCPQGHECEDHTTDLQDPGIYCLLCPDRWQHDDDLLRSGGSVETDGQRVKLYDVYAYPVGVVKAPNVLAASPEAAIEAVYERVEWRDCFASDGDGKNVEFVDFAESFESFYVYEKDPDKAPRLFLEDGKTCVKMGPTMALTRFLEIAPGVCGLLERLLQSGQSADLAQAHQTLRDLLNDVAPRLLEKDQEV
jgi:hypothetical protein